MYWSVPARHTRARSSVRRPLKVARHPFAFYRTHEAKMSDGMNDDEVRHAARLLLLDDPREMRSRLFSPALPVKAAAWGTSTGERQSGRVPFPAVAILSRSNAR